MKIPPATGATEAVLSHNEADQLQYSKNIMPKHDPSLVVDLYGALAKGCELNGGTIQKYCIKLI